MMYAEDESLQIEQVIVRLATRFPSVPPAEIEVVVRGIHERFANAHIHDFVPLLVEKAARQAISDSPASLTGDHTMATI